MKGRFPGHRVQRPIGDAGRRRIGRPPGGMNLIAPDGPRASRPGGSDSPSRRSSGKQRRHLPTRFLWVPGSAAALFGGPSVQYKVMRQWSTRNAPPAVDVPEVPGKNPPAAGAFTVRLSGAPALEPGFRPARPRSIIEGLSWIVRNGIGRAKCRNRRETRPPGRLSRMRRPPLERPAMRVAFGTPHISTPVCACAAQVFRRDRHVLAAQRNPGRPLRRQCLRIVNHSTRLPTIREACRKAVAQTDCLIRSPRQSPASDITTPASKSATAW